jgi:hypothetical protein
MFGRTLYESEVHPGFGRNEIGNDFFDLSIGDSLSS